jgi:thioredoxin type arsenate reductase
MKGILFLCVANSARSQMAEGIARSLASPEINVCSAGLHPTRVRPEAIAVLKEIGIDISHHRSKAISDIPVAEIDTVITLCAEQECPVFAEAIRHLHWDLSDPIAGAGSEEERMTAFRHIRDELRRRIVALFAK